MPPVCRGQALDLRLQGFLSGADLSLPLAVDTSARLVSPLACRMRPEYTAADHILAGLCLRLRLPGKLFAQHLDS